MAELSPMQPKPRSPPAPIPIATALTTLSTPPADEHLQELRVRIPVDLHRQLLSLKILRGKRLAETVSTALDVYFAEHARRAAVASDE